MSTEEQPLDLADLLLIAEAVLGANADVLRIGVQISSAESALAAPWAGMGDTFFYDDPIERCAILCSRIIRNHPLPDGNKRAAYLAMREALHREGFDFHHPDGDQLLTAAMIERLASHEASESEFVKFVQAHTDPA